MFKVTEKAQKKLLHLLQSNNDDPDACTRINLAPGGEQLTLSIDRQQSSDHIIEDKNGKNVLLIHYSLLPLLEDQVFDYQEGHEGGGFTIAPLAPGDQ